MHKMKHASGQILIEVLIGLVVLATIVIVIVQMTVGGSRATKVSGQQAVMTGLAQEALEAVEAIATAKWQDIYGKTKGTQEYYPKVSGGQWTLTVVAGDKTVTVDSVAYQRWVIIDDVCRDNATDDIETADPTPCDSGNSLDPSTEKVTATVTGSGLPNVSYVRYFSRSRNSAAVQTDWSSGSGQTTNPTSGFDANFNAQFDSTDGNLDATLEPGKLQLAQ